MKRFTVATFDRFLQAADLSEVLTQAGVDSKVVTKHAVQIDPQHIEKAKAAIEAERDKRRLEEAKEMSHGD